MMPSLHRIETFNKPDQITTTVHLTTDIVSALAQAQIKSGLLAEFVSLAEEALKRPALRASIRPTNVKRAFEELAAQKRWGVFVQLVCAVQKQPMMFGTIKPAMIKDAASWLLAYKRDPRAKMPDIEAITDYCEMVKAIGAQQRLMAALPVEDVAKISSHLSEHFSHTYREYGQKQPRTIYYPDQVRPFAQLAKAVKGDRRLADGIVTTDLAKAVEVLWNAGLEKTKEYVTSERYETEIPAGFTGFDPLQSFVQAMSDAPEAWKNAIADKIREIANDGFDGRTGVYFAKIIKKHDWLMDVDQFSTWINTESKNGNLFTILYSFSDCERFKPAYPAAIRLWLQAEIDGWGRARIDDNISVHLGQDVIVAGAEMVAKLADEQNYAALSRLVSYQDPKSAAYRAMTAEMSKRGLYRFMMHNYGREDSEMAASMGQCSALDIIFRQSSGDAVICTEPQVGFYLHGQRPARHTIPAATTVMALISAAPADNVPAIQLGFKRAAEGQKKVPVWVQNLAQQMLEAPAVT